MKRKACQFQSSLLLYVLVCFGLWKSANGRPTATTTCSTSMFYNNDIESCHMCTSCKIINRHTKESCGWNSDTVCGSCLPGTFPTYNTDDPSIEEPECLICTKLTTAPKECQSATDPTEPTSAVTQEPPPFLPSSPVFVLSISIAGVFCTTFLIGAVVYRVQWHHHVDYCGNRESERGTLLSEENKCDTSKLAESGLISTEQRDVSLSESGLGISDTGAEESRDVTGDVLENRSAESSEMNGGISESCPEPVQDDEGGEEMQDEDQFHPLRHPVQESASNTHVSSVPVLGNCTGKINEQDGAPTVKINCDQRGAINCDQLGAPLVVNVNLNIECARAAEPVGHRNRDLSGDLESCVSNSRQPCETEYVSSPDVSILGLTSSEEKDYKESLIDDEIDGDLWKRKN